MQEKRRFVRVKPDSSLKAVFRIPDRESYEDCILEDISLGGVGIKYFCEEDSEILNVLNPDSKVVLKLKFLDEKIMEIDSTVRWVLGAKVDDGKCKLNFGIEFDTLKEDNREYLDNYIKDILSSKS